MKTVNETPGNTEMNSAVLNKSISENIKRVYSDFGNSSDLIIKRNSQGTRTDFDYAIIFIKQMADGNSINNISNELCKISSVNKKEKPDMQFELLFNCVSSIRASKKGSDFKSMYKEILSGNTVFLVEDCNQFFSVSTNSNEGRAITEPTSQSIIKGPKDAFTEDIEKNIYLIRKRVKNEALRIEEFILGTVTNTNVKMVYINGIVKSELLNELRQKVIQITYDGILDIEYIEELTKMDRYSIFPTTMSSEKPDAVAAALLEGRVAVLVDGTPYVLTVPALFDEFFQVSEDYYNNFYISSAMRLMRYVAFILTLYVPALFIALTTFHQEIIPTPMLVSIASQREGIPFPAFIEVLFMEITFEIIREAGVRMPRVVGPAISIVGALVIGQAAVEAGLISALVVIVVAITAISSFAITSYNMSNSIRILRFGLILLAGVLGLYGITMGSIIIILHLCKLKTGTVPYLTPVAPRIKGENKDIIFRFPLWSLKKRPTVTSATDTPRTDNQTPDPKSKGLPELK